MLGVFMAILRPLAYLSLPILAIRFLSARSKMVHYYARLFLYLSGVGVVSACGMALPLVAVVGQRQQINFLIGRLFYTFMSRVMGITFEVEGLHHLDTRPAVIISNHQSMLDLLYLGAVFPTRTIIMGKKELRYVPLLGQFMMLAGNIFIDRSNNKNAAKSLTEAGDKMKRDHTSLWVFPEGTRTLSEEPQMKPFKKGAFNLAVQGEIPIVPVVLENYWRLYRPGVFGSGKLKVRVLPPISTKGLKAEDVNDLAIQARTQMVQVLKEISVPYTGPKKAEEKGPSIGVTEMKREGSEPVHVPGLGASNGAAAAAVKASTSREGAVSGTSETEEEDGHVLVRKPNH